MNCINKMCLIKSLITKKVLLNNIKYAEKLIFSFKIENKNNHYRVKIKKIINEFKKNI